MKINASSLRLLLAAATTLPAFPGPLLGDSGCFSQNKPSVTDCSRDATPPTITVYAADKAGSFYSDDFTLRGTIKSACPVSAGIFEAQGEVGQIQLKGRSGQITREFEVTVDASQEPEIHAVSQSGAVTVYKIDVLDIRG